ncbi:MAG: hypothetical protein HUU55_06120 [Myxococcales bacterium]|nr:hypothetical protein [Myxococcales bacterium]
MLTKKHSICAKSKWISPTWLWFVGTLACSSTGGNHVGATDSGNGNTQADSQTLADALQSDTAVSSDVAHNGDASPSGFLTNPNFCATATGFHSAVVAVGIAQPEDISAFAAELVANGYAVIHHLPDSPIPPEDVVSSDTVVADTAENGDVVPTADAAAPPALDAGPGDVSSAGDMTSVDAVVVPDDVVEPDAGEVVWPGEDIWGEYVVVVSPLGDVTYLLSNGDMVVASACPLDSLGQIRRLDFALAKAVQVLSKVQGTDYAEETRRWAVPTAYYGDTAGGYWREYFNESLDLNKVQSGVLSCSTTPLAGAFGIYGRADSPSLVGDVIGVESLTVGGITIVQDQKQTSSGEVAMVWNLMPHIGAGEVTWSVDLLVSDASVGFNVGKYYPFIDVLFSSEKQAALIVNIQGTLPGANRTSRAISELTLPPAPNL